MVCQEYSREVKGEITSREFNWSVAQLQKEAGHYEQAVSTLNDLADAAFSEGDQVYTFTCDAEIDRINALVKNASNKNDQPQ